MPPRPAGTDGSDYNHREVIVERYKRMADFKNAISKLIGLHVVFVFLKVAWHFAVFKMGGDPVPYGVLGMVGGELVLQVVLQAAKLGQSKESLRLLKTYNIIQALLTAQVVLSAWQYHQGTQTGGVAQYTNSKVAAAYLSSHYAGLPGNLLDICKALELFLDMVTSAFLAMATFVSHKMIVEKMQMKAEKGTISAKDRKGAIKGGGDSDDESDGDEGAPDAVPISQEKPKVAKAAASMRRRHA